MIVGWKLLQNVKFPAGKPPESSWPSKAQKGMKEVVEFPDVICTGWLLIVAMLPISPKKETIICVLKQLYTNAISNCRVML